MTSPVREVSQHPPDDGCLWFLVALVLLFIYLIFAEIYEAAGIAGVYMVGGAIVAILTAFGWALFMVYARDSLGTISHPQNDRDAWLSGVAVFFAFVLAEIVGWPTFVALLQTSGLRGVLYFLGGFMVSVVISVAFWRLVCWLVDRNQARQYDAWLNSRANGDLPPKLTRLSIVLPFLSIVGGLPVIVGLFALAFHFFYR